MGHPDRPAAIDLSESSVSGDIATTYPVSGGILSLPEKVREYHFFQLTELLQQLLGQDPERVDWEQSSRLLFGTDPGLGFAASDVTALSNLGQDKLRLEGSFLGLSGAHSPLPGFMLEQIANEGEQGLRRQFLDFFNHRLLTLVYGIWRKYRYYIRFREDAQDGFSAQLFALVGLADQNLRGETPINWCKMLSYAGMLAGRSRSPQVVSGIIAHCFDLQDVSIRQWELRQVPIPTTQQFCLGQANACLGQDTVIGTQVADRMGKFVICLRGLSLSRFGDFLPSGREYLPLLTLVEFILREQMAFDLELGLNPDEVKPMQLGSAQPVSLGWSSFTGQSHETRYVRIQIRQ